MVEMLTAGTPVLTAPFPSTGSPCGTGPLALIVGRSRVTLAPVSQLCGCATAPAQSHGRIGRRLSRRFGGVSRGAGRRVAARAGG